MKYKKYKYFRISNDTLTAHIAIKEEEVEILDLDPNADMTPELFCDLVDQLINTKE